MPLVDALLPEFDHEMTVTRKLLERVPEDKLAWKPHPRSFRLAHLAQLVATMPAWIPMTIDKDAIDLSESPGYSVESTSALQSRFDTLVAAARRALEGVTEAAWDAPWSLRHGANVLMTMPRGASINSARGEPETGLISAEYSMPICAADGAASESTSIGSGGN